MSRLSDPELVVRRLLLGVVLAWLVLLLAVAVLVPFHATDALVYGSWSERIAELGTLRTPGAGNALLHRPFYYGIEGGLWGLFGVHEWIGRLWSYVFMGVLVWSVYRLAQTTRRDLLTAAVAVVVLLAVPDVAAQAAAGQTDVPVAALAALAAALVWSFPPAPWRMAALVVTVAAASLTKPSVLPALLGIGLATLIGPPRELRTRLLRDTLPIVAGVAIAMVYHVIQSRYLGHSLYDFLAGATEDPRAVAAVNAQVGQTYAEARKTIVVSAQWMGPYVAVLALYSVLYALLRVVSVGHRLAARIVFPAAIVLSWLLPYVGQADARTVRVGPLDTSQPAAILAFLLLLVPLWLFTMRTDAERAPDRTLLARMLVWIAPLVFAWYRLNPSETRYLSAAWAPFVVLMAVVLAGALRAELSRNAKLAIAVALVPLALLAFNLRSFDALGTRPDGTYNAFRAAADLRPNDLFHPERMRALADPQLAGLLNASRAATGPDGRLLTDDGRMIFFFLDRLQVRRPAGCADLQGFQAVGLLANLIAPPDLRGCAGFHVRQSVPGSYIVYGR